MSTAASIYFSHTDDDIKYAQMQNTSTTTAAVLYRHVFPLRLMPVQELKKNSRVQVTSKTVAFRFFLTHANPVHGQLNREKCTCSRSRLSIWFRETDLAVPSRVSLLILHTQAESGAYSRDCSRCPLRRPYIFPTSTTI